MRMDDQGESQNVEDVRGSSGGFRPVHGIGLGTIVVALIGGWVFGINPLQILGLLSGGGSSIQAPASDDPGQPPPAGDPEAKFVSQVLRSTEQVWTTAFQERGAAYEEPKLRLFRDAYPSACGLGGTSAQRVSWFKRGVETGQIDACDTFAAARL